MRSTGMLVWLLAGCATVGPAEVAPTASVLPWRVERGQRALVRRVDGSHVMGTVTDVGDQSRPFDDHRDSRLLWLETAAGPVALQWVTLREIDRVRTPSEITDERATAGALGRVSLGFGIGAMAWSTLSAIALAVSNGPCDNVCPGIADPRECHVCENRGIEWMITGVLALATGVLHLCGSALVGAVAHHHIVDIDRGVVDTMK